MFSGLESSAGHSGNAIHASYGRYTIKTSLENILSRISLAAHKNVNKFI
jgi:hypothetical protein